MSATRLVTYVRPRMGTLLAVTLPRREADLGPDLAGVFATATVWERVMSHYESTTPLARLNRHAGDSAGVASRALATVVGLGRDLAARTGGAFDPTIAPLAKLWRRAARRGRLPSPRQLERARRLVSWRSIEVDASRVALRARGMALDLGALGKGIALDRIARRLRRGGCRSALVNFGESSLVAIGRPPRGRWRVALRHPDGGFAGEFALDDRACSTSATWGQTVRLGRAVLGHIVDPRTGWPLRRRAQVSVLASSATVAEAVSTALLVLGPGAMNGLARDFGIDACWIDRAGVRTTPAFAMLGSA
jgi:FAD:protein FMN transferase